MERSIYVLDSMLGVGLLLLSVAETVQNQNVLKLEEKLKCKCNYPHN